MSDKGSFRIEMERYGILIQVVIIVLELFRFCDVRI